MAASENLRQQQFNLGGLEKAFPALTEHPGHLDRQEWTQRQDVVHHGTFRKDWDQPVAAHFAHDPEIAASMLLTTETRSDWSNYGSLPEGHETGPDEFSHIGQGRIHSRRLPFNLPSEYNVTNYPETLDPVPLHDAAANAAHAVWARREHGEIPSPTVRASAGLSKYSGDDEMDLVTEDLGAKRGIAMLRQGTPIVYRNDVEGGVGVVAPRGSTRTYEQDFLEAPTRSPHAKALMEASLRQVGPLSTPIPDISYGNQQRRELVGQQQIIQDPDKPYDFDAFRQPHHTHQPIVGHRHEVPVHVERGPAASLPRPQAVVQREGIWLKNKNRRAESA